jgi:hypothetical protein
VQLNGAACVRARVSVPAVVGEVGGQLGGQAMLRVTNGLGMLAGHAEAGRSVLSAQVSRTVQPTVVDRWSLSLAGRYGTWGARPVRSRMRYGLHASC